MNEVKVSMQLPNGQDACLILRNGVSPSGRSPYSLQVLVYDGYDGDGEQLFSARYQSPSAAFKEYLDWRDQLMVNALEPMRCGTVAAAG